MPLMTASHFFAFSAAMMESNVVFLKLALTPICAATAEAMSMSEPIGLVEPVGIDSSGGYVASVQKVICPADLIAGGGVTEAAATPARASAPRMAAAAAMVFFPLMPFLSTVSGLLRGTAYAGSAADVRHLDLRQGRRLGRAQLGIAVGAARPDAAERVGERLVGGAGAKRPAQVVPAQREQTGVQAPLGRQPCARAAAAERLRHRGDDADLAGAVPVAPATRGRVRPGRDRLDRPLRVDATDDLLGGDDVVEPPAVRVADVHVLDEAQHVAGAAEALGGRDDPVVVRAALDDGVDLHRQAGRGGGVDSLEPAGDG